MMYMFKYISIALVLVALIVALPVQVFAVGSGGGTDVDIAPFNTGGMESPVDSVDDVGNLGKYVVRTLYSIMYGLFLFFGFWDAIIYLKTGNSPEGQKGLSSRLIAAVVFLLIALTLTAWPLIVKNVLTVGVT
jgi:hypothetical protein